MIQALFFGLEVADARFNGIQCTTHETSMFVVRGAIGILSWNRADRSSTAAHGPAPGVWVNVQWLMD